MNRPHGKGYIGDTLPKAKSAAMTTEGAKRAAESFEKHFSRSK